MLDGSSRFRYSTGYVFLIVQQIFVSSYPDFLELTFSMISVSSTALQLQFVFVTSFLLLDQLRDLPLKKWLLYSLMEL